MIDLERIDSLTKEFADKVVAQPGDWQEAWKQINQPPPPPPPPKEIPLDPYVDALNKWVEKSQPISRG